MYSLFTKIPELESHYQMQFSVISRILDGMYMWEGLIPLQRCSRGILQSQPAGLLMI